MGLLARYATPTALIPPGNPASALIARRVREVLHADQAHLTRWFRRCYGVTPGAYRQAVGSR